MEPITTPMEPAPPAHSLLPVTGDRCPACGAALGKDQRYCLECGERTGEPRLAMMSGRFAPEPPAAVAVPPRRRRPTASSGTTLLAGLGVLVLALGVGVEIGKDNTRAPASAPTRIVTVPAAGGAATTAAATATPAPGATAATDARAAKKAAKGKAAAAAKTQKPAVSAVITPSAKATPPPVTKLGSKGHGKGYKNGKFTGDFFGGG